MSSPSRRARRRRLIVVSMLVAGPLLLSACGGSDDASQSATESSTTPTSSATEVVIDTFMFSPKTLHLKVGDTVTWTNHDDIVHTVTSGTRDYESGNSGHVTETHKSGMFDSPLDGKGATTTYTFTKAGTFHYFCDRHPGMEADIEVS